VHGLHVDLAVAEDERIDAVVGAGPAGIGGPLEEKHVIRPGLVLDVPGRLGQVGEQLRERCPDTVLAAAHARGRDHDGVIGEIGDDFIDVCGGKCRAVVGEYFLGRARHRILLAIRESQFTIIQSAWSSSGRRPATQRPPGSS
jgi:hypothetical protein